MFEVTTRKTPQEIYQKFVEFAGSYAGSPQICTPEERHGFIEAFATAAATAFTDKADENDVYEIMGEINEVSMNVFVIEILKTTGIGTEQGESS